MIRLTNAAGSKIRAALAAAVSTTAPYFIASYSDKTSTAYSGASITPIILSNSAADMIGAPAASTIRDIDFMSVYNADSIAHTLTLTFYDGTNSRTLKVFYLNPGDSMEYTHAGGFKVLDSNGQLKSGVSATVNVTVETFTGDGSETDFVIAGSPGTKNACKIHFDGVYQPKSQYSLSGSTITFTSAPADGVGIEIEYMTSVLIGVPSDDTVSTVKIQDGAVTSAKLDSGDNFTTLTATSIDTAADTVLVWDDSANTWKVSTVKAVQERVLLGTQTASSSSALTFTDVTGYTHYEIEIVGLQPATDGAELAFRMSTDNGSNYATSNYQWQYLYHLHGTGVTGNDSTSSGYIPIGGSNDGAVDIGTALIRVHSLGTSLKIITYQYFGRDTSGNQYTMIGSGVYSNASVANAFQFLMSSGNITAGTFRLWGIR